MFENKYVDINAVINIRKAKLCLPSYTVQIYVLHLC